MKDWQDAIAGAVVCSRPCMICDFECVSNPAELQSGPYSTPPHMIRSRLCSTTGGAGLTRRKAALHEKAYQKRIQCRLSRRSLQAHVRPCWCKLTNVQSLLLHLQATVAAGLKNGYTCCCRLICTQKCFRQHKKGFRQHGFRTLASCHFQRD